MSCSSPDPPDYCSAASPELKLYQAFIFSVPVFFTFILLLFFYLFYLRRRRANWQSLRMRSNNLIRGDIPRASESGLKKEVRELLPVVIFKESFLIRETQCSVCLADYQPDERLQRIPPCGHTFHVDCIDHWLSTNSTCPLCRVSLLPAAKATSVDPVDLEAQDVGEDHLHEQYEEGLATESVDQHQNQAAEGGRECANQDLVNTRDGEEVVRHDAEASIRVHVGPQFGAEGSRSVSGQQCKPT